ncbi:NXPE family member 2-like [Patiria miniata]|uniref:NXPE C-terminal domain-containing protein n=1 Tax=Patiria miniata TaxID=46514 RepID=A0A913ZU31_PATMI|nr:NXPE family member 2-like [Patiria miniata]
MCKRCTCTYMWIANTAGNIALLKFHMHEPKILIILNLSGSIEDFILHGSVVTLSIATTVAEFGREKKPKVVMMVHGSPCERPWPNRFFWPMSLLVIFAIGTVVLYSTTSPIKQVSLLPQPAVSKDLFRAQTETPIRTVTSALTSTYRLVEQKLRPIKQVSILPQSAVSTSTDLFRAQTKTPMKTVTSALTSTYRLVEQTLRVSNTAHFVIQAKDSSGRNMTSGGDFWFTFLTSVEGDHPTTGGRTAGSVVDHNNGTYSVSFYVGWSGIAYVHMTLAAPSEATKWLRDKYWPVEKRVFWKADFWGKHSIETAACFVQRNVTSTSHLCTIDHNPKAMGLTALYCEKPHVAKCEDFKTIAVDPEMVNTRTLELLQGDITLFKGENYLQPLTRGPKSFTIAQSQSNRTTDTRAPVCKPDEEPLANDGFWLDAEWHHLQCKVHRWEDVKAVRACLRHKHVFFHGDSNIRSWYCVLTRKLGYPWQHLGTGNGKMTMHNYYPDNQIETSFYFHPRVITTAKINLDATPYEVDILDNIPTDECNRYIIALCPWGHFTQWTRESFTERTNLLKDAVLRFRERCPGVPIVLKGTHTREHESTLKTVYGSDYTLWHWGRTLRDTFRGTGVFFYDVWQMSLAYGKPDIHMPLEVINEEVNWFLSYVCR